MPNRASDLLERIKHYGSRVSLHDRATAVTAASIVLVVALIGLVVLGGSTDDRASRVGDGSAAQQSPDSVVAGSSGPATTAPDAASRPSGPTTSVTDEVATVPDAANARPDFGKNARGVTDKEILVGAPYDKNAGGINTALGAEGIGQIDSKAAIEHVRDYINSKGGIGGRKIRIVWHEYDSLSGKSVNQIGQEMCTTWTQDNHVFAAGAGSEPANLAACLAKAGVVQVNPGGGISDSKTLREHPYLVETSNPALDRMARFYVDQLHARGFYDRGRSDQPKLPFKLGLVTWDEPVFARATDAFRAQLDAKGIKLSEVASVHRSQSEAEIAETIAGIRAAVLQFKGNNVTHVQFLSTSNAFEQFTFWIQADQQLYYPRYGLTSLDGAQALITTIDSAQGKGASARTFRDSLSVGWRPLRDVPRSDYSGEKESPALRLCKKLLPHESFDDPARNKEATAADICDATFYLKAALEKAGPVVNQKSWLWGVANVGTVPSAATFEMATTATRHDGMNAIRDLRFFADCTCFHYTSGNKKV